MSNRSDVRHENTLRDLKQVIEEWDEFYPDEVTGAEQRARDEFPAVIEKFYYELVADGLIGWEE